MEKYRSRVMVVRVNTDASELSVLRNPGDEDGVLREMVAHERSCFFMKLYIPKSLFTASKFVKNNILLRLKQL